MAKQGLYSNIRNKQARIAKGSGEKMRKPGSKGAPTAAAFKDAAKTAKPVIKASAGGPITGAKTMMKKKGFSKGGVAKKGMKKKGYAKGGAVKKMANGGMAKKGMAKKGYAKGGAVKKMANGGMAKKGMAKKGYAKGGVAKMKAGGTAMTATQLRAAAKGMGMKVVKI